MKTITIQLLLSILILLTILSPPTSAQEITSKQIEQLRQELTQLDSLTAQAELLWWQIKFEQTLFLTPDTDKLTRTLNSTQTRLTTVQQSIDEMLSQMDNYEGLNWQEKFGTLYEPTRTLQMALITIRAKSLCLTTDPSKTNLADTLRELRGVYELNSDENIELRLLIGRLLRTIAADNPERLTEVREYFTPLENTALAPQTKLEKILCRLQCNQDYKIELDNLEKSLTNSTGLWPLRILILRNLTATNHKTTEFLPSPSQLIPCKQLRSRNKDARAIIDNWLGQILAAALKNFGSIEKLPRPLDDIETEILAQLYTEQKNHTALIDIYQEFIRTHLRDHPNYNPTLYNLGRAFYQLGHQNNNPDDLAQAVSTWLKLAENKPDTEEFILETAAKVAYQLFTIDNEKYAGLAQKTFALFSVRHAPSPAVDKQRYYYGQILRQLNNHPAAREQFLQARTDDTNYPQAKYYAALSALETPELYQQAPSELETIAQQKDNQTALYAAVKLAEIYLNETPPRPQQCLNILKPFNNLPKNQREIIFHLKFRACQTAQDYPRSLSELTEYLNQGGSNIPKTLLAAIRQEILELHSKDDDKLAPLLRAALPVARKMQDKWSLEIIALAALADPREELITAAQSLLDKFPSENTLWQIRVKAQLAFATGDYESSRKLWYTIRKAVDNDGEPQSKYYWWEARFYGIQCLRRCGQDDEANHAIEVLLKTTSDEQSPWRARLAE